VSAAPKLRPLALPLGVVVTLAGGCEAQGDGEDACGEAQPCDVPASRAELLAALDGFEDPVAAWLRVATDDDATLPGDHEDALAGLRAELGCDATRERSFVVLSNAAYAPKALVTQCTDAPVDASRVLTVFEPTADGDDLDATRFRMAAWDAEAGRFHRYQFVPTEGGLGVSVEPAFCTGCHGGPYALPEWAPIMNEMTNPWAMWNAEPGFASFAFAEHFPADFPAGGEVYEGLAKDGRLDSASNLEPVVRAAIDRVVSARLATRTVAPDLDAAAALLRPVFCDESANYVSEIHDSGEIAQSVALDPGIRRMLLAIDPTGWPWTFVQDDALFLTPPSADERPLALVGVRGETTVQMEAALVARDVLDPVDVLRVRALDWTHPVASELRCGLFEAGLARARAGAVDAAAAADTSALVRALYDEAIAVTASASLADVGPDAVVALADANDGDAVANLRAGDFTETTMTLSELGDAIESELLRLAEPGARADLELERIRRGCLLRARDVTAPLVPAAEDCP
jgi:hypothetical protein